MSITLTESAADRVKTFLEKRGKGIGLRLGIKTSGCSGLSYMLEFVDTLNEDDQVFEQHGVKSDRGHQKSSVFRRHPIGFCQRRPK